MDVLKEIKRLLRRSLSASDKAFLFGSRARGEASKESDWDILVILDKDRLDMHDYDLITYPLVEYGWEIDQNISPILYTKNEWLRQSFTPFFKNIEQDKIPLT